MGNFIFQKFGRSLVPCRLNIALASIAIALVAIQFDPTPTQAQWSLPSWNLLSPESPPGSPAWWKKHRDEAQFVPHQGYQVPGYEGFFDKDGRPMQGPVASGRIAIHDEKQEAGLIPAIDPMNQYKRVKNAVGLGENESVAQRKYAEADKLFREKRYSAAANRYAEAADRAIDVTLKTDALFMLAECYYFDDKYFKARDAYNALVEANPNSRHMDTLVERLWQIARYWEQYEEHSPDWSLTPNLIDKTRPTLDTIGHAIKTYENIRMNDPTGPRADDAIMAAANIYFRDGKFDDADYNYSLLRREYPRSEHQFDAHVLGLQAKLRKYQGADYDGAPLEDAKKLLKQIKVQFAGRLDADERDRLTLVDAQLNREIVNRDVRMAQYYEGTEHFGAARYYYAEVLKNNPDTELAATARERIAQLSDQPDAPPMRLSWFVDLFPESSEITAVARIPELQNDATRLAREPDDARTDTDATTTQ